MATQIQVGDHVKINPISLRHCNFTTAQTKGVGKVLEEVEVLPVVGRVIRIKWFYRQGGQVFATTFDMAAKHCYKVTPEKSAK